MNRHSKKKRVIPNTHLELSVVMAVVVGSVRHPPAPPTPPPQSPPQTKTERKWATSAFATDGSVGGKLSKRREAGGICRTAVLVSSTHAVKVSVAP